MSVREHSPRVLATCAFLICAALIAGEPSADVKPLLTKPGKVLFSEDFKEVPHERDRKIKTARRWMSGKGKWEMKDGVLVGAEKPEEKHGAMLTSPRFTFHNATVQVSFRLDGARAFTLDANAKGRIVAVSVSSTSLKLSRSLEGGDKMEVLDTVPLKLESGTWYTLLLEMQGKEIVASIDGKQAAFGGHERLDLDKTSIQLRVSGESVAFQNLIVRETMPSDSWEATKAKLLNARK